MNEESNNHRIDPELEARIVALVLGEVSELERESLLSLLKVRPELALFQREIESAHHLMKQLGTGEWPKDDDDWKLSSGKRDRVLAAIGENASVPATLPAATPKPWRPWRLLAADDTNWKLIRIAASICGAGIFVLLFAVTLLLKGNSRVALIENSAGRGHVFGFERDFETNAAPAAAARSDSLWMDLGTPGTKRVEDSPTLGLQGVAAGTSRTDVPAAAVPTPAPESLVDDGRSTAPFFDSLDVPEFQKGLDVGSERLSKGVVIADNYVAADPFGEPSSGSAPAKDDRRGVRLSDLDKQAAVPVVGDFAVALQYPSAPPAVELSIQAEDQSQIVDDPMPMFGRDAAGEKELAEAVDMPTVDHRFGRVDREFMDSQLPRLMIEEDEEVAQNGFDPNGRVAGIPGQTADAPTTAGSIVDSKSVTEMDSTVGLGFQRPTEDAEVHEFFYSGSGVASTLVPEKVPTKPIGAVDRLLAVTDSLAREKESRPAINAPFAGRAIVPQQDKLFGMTKAERPLVRKEIASLDEVSAAEEAFSTFSLHVSDVSFKLAQSALAQGQWPDASKVRVEEFVNAFDYGDPMPNDHEKVACVVEQGVHPFLQQRNVMRVSMRTAAAGRASSTPLRITFLLDNSGSMERIDRQQTVRLAFALLAQQLTPIDQVTLISFARQPRLLADQVNGSQSSQLTALVDELPSEGGTNLEAALQLAFEKAVEQRIDGAQNRIVLLTDGAVNLGDANPERLSQMITDMRDSGIAFDAAGISADGLNDEVLEALTRQGDGRYYLLDSAESADKGFVKQIAGALRPSAKNVKVQVEFNPLRVGRYKLLGFEKHRLNQEDFRNDSVDAAEMAAEEAGVAVYQFEALPNGEGDVGSVSVRFRDLSTGEMVENRWPIPYEADALRVDQAAPSLNIATVASMFASKLRGDAIGETVEWETLAELMAALPDQVRKNQRVQQLQTMIEQARQVSGNP